MLRQDLVSGSVQAPVWYPDGLCFSCTQCGNCCIGAPGYVWVDDQEIDAIARRLSLTRGAFEARHIRRIGKRFSLRELPGGDCEFLIRNANGTTACGIYAVRPLQCRTWPFWKSNLRSPEAWAAAARDCPGINRGPRHLLPVVQAAMFGGAARPI